MLLKTSQLTDTQSILFDKKFFNVFISEGHSKISQPFSRGVGIRNKRNLFVDLSRIGCIYS